MGNWVTRTLAVFTMLSISGCSQNIEMEPVESLTPTLILISIDGVRHDYIDMYNPPHLTALAEEGLTADGLQPVFPSKTFPNHFSLVTGLYAENHGIIGNNIYDPEHDDVFGLSIKEAIQNGRWWQGEPIWITAERQGVTAATYFFPGSEAEINELRPSYWHEYDGRVPNRTRVQAALDWLQLPNSERPQFISFYFSDVDSAGHGHGPKSDEVREALLSVDEEIGYLISQLKELGVYEQVNIMITSDHGMYEVDQRNHTVIDTAFDTTLTQYVTYSREIVGIHALRGQSETIYQQLQASIPPEEASVFYKSDIPERFHYQRNERIPDIFVLAQPGNILVKESWLEDMLASDDYLEPRGSHGYDNQIEEMHGIFIARGPQFKNATQLDTVKMVDIYNVMSTALGILPAVNDGDPNVIPMMMNERSISE